MHLRAMIDVAVVRRGPNRGAAAAVPDASIVHVLRRLHHPGVSDTACVCGSRVKGLIVQGFTHRDEVPSNAHRRCIW